MSLPNYIVNLEELFESILKAYYNHMLYEGGKKDVGSKRKKVNPKEKVNFVFQYDSPIFLEKINFLITEKRNIGYNNNWSLFIDGEKIFDSIYVKESDEEKPFFSPLAIDKSKEIKIEFLNNGEEELEIIFELEFFKKDLLGNVIVVCVDEDTRKIINYSATPVLPNANSKIQAPSLDGYIAHEEYKEIMLQLPSLTQVTYFYYTEV